MMMSMLATKYQRQNMQKGRKLIQQTPLKAYCDINIENIGIFSRILIYIFSVRMNAILHVL